MPVEDTKFLVCEEGNCATLAIVGRACYLNCMGVSEFFDTAVRDKKAVVNIDFAECTGVDSTFLGIIAKLAIRLRPNNGKVVLCNISDRNLEVVQNLGLDKILEIGNPPKDGIAAQNTLSNSPSAQSEMLSAHESLVRANPENLKKFEDVIAFLKKRVE